MSRFPAWPSSTFVDREADIIKLLWDTMDVQELVLSIAASGYFKHEPVIVCRERGRNVVIEGNRRLAAVKLLLRPRIGQELNAKIPEMSKDLRKAHGALSTGYDGSKALLGVASAVADLAYDLHEEMERKSAPRRDRRRNA